MGTNVEDGSYKFSSDMGAFSMPKRYSELSKMIIRDLNTNNRKTTFQKYSKDDISDFLSNPETNEKQLRDAVTYIYGASTHFKRLIQYFASLTDLAYVVAPYNIEQTRAKVETIERNYRKTLNVLSAMNIRSQFTDILMVCLREDTYYGTMHVNNDAIILQQLPSDYCKITTIENNVANVTFNFQYFDSRKDLLPYFPKEFETKYNVYKKNSMNKWIELDSPTSFAIKCNKDILNYSLPPFAGLLREVYDIEDYKALKATKTELENYAVLLMKLPMNDDGEYALSYDRAKQFWSNLDQTIPEEIGSVLSPMDLTKISFDKSNVGDTNRVAEAEEQLFTAAGVSSLLFNNVKAGSSALAMSVKVDQAMTFGIVKSIEDMVNRYVHSLGFGKNFRVTFIDSSPFNRKEMSDAYLKASSYGIPMISYYAAVQGLNQSELDCMSFLEGTVLDLQNKFKPLVDTSHASASSLGEKQDGAGRPTLSDEDITDSGEQSREDGDSWG